jgi:hypothetical protein
MLDGLISIVGGLLAASALIVAKKPNAKELLAKLTPYTGWIGTLMFFWGTWETINLVRFAGMIFHRPIFGAFYLATTVSDLVVGFLLGFGLITKYALSSSPAAMAKGDGIRAKLVPYQATFGLVSIVCGVLYILWSTVL